MKANNVIKSRNRFNTALFKFPPTGWFPMTCTPRPPQTMQMSASCLHGASPGQWNNAARCRRELRLSCPRVLGELFMKVLTEEKQVQQGAFLWGATTADSQVGFGLVLRPLDFNDGPVVSLCEPNRVAFLLCQLKRVVACKFVISAVAPLHRICFFFFSLMSSRSIAYSVCLRFSPPHLPHFLISF